MKRTLYFLSQKLRITRAERTSVLILCGIMMIAPFIEPVISREFNADHYEYSEIIAEFEVRSSAWHNDRQELLARYNPGTAGMEQVAAVQATEMQTDETIEDTVHVEDSTKPDLTVDQGDDEKINVNEATLEELVELPGIGPAIAARIIEYREQHGEFESVEDLINVRGIGEARLDNIRELVTV